MEIYAPAAAPLVQLAVPLPATGLLLLGGIGVALAARHRPRLTSPYRDRR